MNDLSTRNIYTSIIIQLYNKTLLQYWDIIHTFRVVVLHSDDFASSFLSIAANCFSIDRFYGEWVNHADVDSIDGQFVCCLQGFEQGHTATNHCHLVAVTLAYHLQHKLTKSQQVYNIIEAYQSIGLNVKWFLFFKILSITMKIQLVYSKCTIIWKFTTGVNFTKYTKNFHYVNI